MLFRRHDGHKQKAQGYYRANDDIVKYGFWVLITLILCIWLALRIFTAYYHKKTVVSINEKRLQRQEDKKVGVRAVYEQIRRRRHKVSNLRIASSNGWIQYFTPPATGQALFLSIYWALILASLWTNVIFKSPSDVFGIQWEVVGFRAAWVSTMQLPLLYATGCRFNIISLMTGITHERLNWFHRWIARTVFMTLIVHWSFFFREWVIAGFVKQELEIMPMVTWGFVAWGAIGLMVLTGFGWFRDQFFEIWLVSHIALAWAVLALSYTHTHCTTYFVGASIAMLLFDLAGRTMSVLLRNISRPGGLNLISYLGHRAKLEVLDDDYLRLVIYEPSFKWKAGQHIYLNIPQVRPLESHPFTILGATVESSHPKQVSLSLIIKRHAGFTKSLHEKVSRTPNCHLRAFLQGPYGNPPKLHNRSTTILIASGNRASVSISCLMETACPSHYNSDVIFHWVVPNDRMVNWYREELQWCVRAYQACNSRLSIHVHVTRASASASRNKVLLEPSRALANDAFSVGRDSMESDCSSNSLMEAKVGMDDPPQAETLSLLSKSAPAVEADPADLEKQRSYDEEVASPTSAASPLWDPYDETLAWMLTPEAGKGIEFSLSYSRPSADELVRPTVSETEDKIAILAAVPPVLAADLGKAVNRLLDESGRDIELWIEENGS